MRKAGSYLGLVVGSIGCFASIGIGIWVLAITPESKTYNIVSNVGAWAAFFAFCLVPFTLSLVVASLFWVDLSHQRKMGREMKPEVRGEH